MSILTGFKKQKQYSTDHDGNHKLVSTWTHADTVDVGNDAVLSDVFTYDPRNQEVNMQAEGFDTIDGGAQATLQPGSLGTTYRKRGSDNHVTNIGTAALNSNFLTYGAILGLRTLSGSDDYKLEARANDIILSGTYDDTSNTWDGVNKSLKNALTGIHVYQNITPNSSGSAIYLIPGGLIATALNISSFDLDDYCISSSWLEKNGTRIFYNDGSNDLGTETHERILELTQSGQSLFITLDLISGREYSLHLIFQPISAGHEITLIG